MAHTQAETRLPLAGGMLLSSLADNWWLLLLRGLSAIAFGILAFFWPGLTLLTLILLWGVYALCDGVFALGAAIFAKGGDMGPRWWLASWHRQYFRRRSDVPLPRHDGPSFADVYRRLGDHYRPAADLGCD